MPFYLISEDYTKIKEEFSEDYFLDLRPRRKKIDFFYAEHGCEILPENYETVCLFFNYLACESSPNEMFLVIYIGMFLK